MAQEAEGTSAKSTLLQSEIEVTWQDKAQGLAQLLADRLGVPFSSPVPLDTQVSVKQAGGSTVANLISTVNSQLPQGSSFSSRKLLLAPSWKQ
jgi:type IV secretory pathway ATPase VirB11/archaellum biosynthesis ATPase